MTAVIAWRGPSLLDGAPIRLQMVWHSTNSKTGDMVQAYILRDDVSPLAAMASGADSSICGDCVFRGEVTPDGARSGRACYVNVGHGPQATWKADMPETDMHLVLLSIRGRMVRMGAYGDPSAVPLDVWWRMAVEARGWTAYTHQWRTLPVVWRRLFMASVDSEAQALAAKAMGWRRYRVLADGEAPMADEIVCPNTTRGVQCHDCGLCNGTGLDDRRRNVKSIVIEAHGAGRRYV